MQTKLSKIADITSGYTFRGSLENLEGGDVFVLQAKNVIANSDLTNTTDLTSTSSESIRKPFFLQYNDILIVSRGSGLGSFRSTVFTSSQKNVIASSSVHIIRINDVTVLPKYISLWLNSSEGQKLLLQIVTGGSYIQSILLKNLAELEIPIPPIHTQKSIVALEENIKQQQKILDRKKEIKENIINATFNNLIKN
jgi:restriction endonuclease S subunit